MSQEPPNPNPSQTVERIREIIVGRHFDKLEQRVALLEQTASEPMSGSREISTHLEAKVEALEHRFQRFTDAVRVENDARENRQHEEIRRLADHIQRTVTAQAPESSKQLETKLGEWLGQWQWSAHQQMIAREHELATYLHREIATLRHWVQSQLNTMGTAAGAAPPNGELRHRFALIAQAARALAQAADPASHLGQFR